MERIAHDISESTVVDYNRLVNEFGTQKITDDQIKRIEQLTGRNVHHLLRRQIVFSHRDLDRILNLVEQKKPFYLYTGRGPSKGSCHLGHLVPFMVCKYLQEAFNVPLVIQITDDEKFIFKNQPLHVYQSYAKENIKDIIAMGFCPEKTFIFQNTKYIGQLYPAILEMQKHLTVSEVQGSFGIRGEENVGKMCYPTTQMAPCLSSSFPHLFPEKAQCLIPCAIDQDPFFRLARDVCRKLKYPKPCLIYTKFLPGLGAPNTKMSSSSSEDAVIFLSDDLTTLRQKIGKSFSGGQNTLELHKELGGNPDVDIAFQYLTFFMEDDHILEDIRDKYLQGELSSGGIKTLCVDVIQPILESFQERRSKINQDLINQFMKHA